MTGTLKAFSDIFFPPSCLFCEIKITRTDVLLCDRCLTTVTPLESPCCSGCGKPFEVKAAGENHFCSKCLKNFWQFDKAAAFFLYKDPISHLIHSLKYSGHTCSLKSLINLAKEHSPLPLLEKQEIIIPVPLHKKRLKERGFNQALFIARALFPSDKNLINSSVLQKHRWTEAQTNYDGASRRKNLSGAFSVSDPTVVMGKKVLLIDDVFTTGTTVNECARVLRKAGATRVQVITLARVDL